jgi:hypothetical protein
MSEQQKLFASLSGALVAHLIFFLLVFGFLTTRKASSSAGRAGERPPAEAAAPEITLVMSELMEQVRVESPEAGLREFVSADLIPGEKEAPAEARFESDRNLFAASSLRPDENLRQEEGPTLVGKNPLPHLTLANRNYRMGETPAQDPSGAALMPLSANVALPAVKAAPLPSEAGSGTAETAADPVKSNLSELDAARRVRPEGTIADAVREEAGEGTRKSFLDPNADSRSLAPESMPEEEGRLGERGGSEGGPGGEPDERKGKSTPESAISGATASLPADKGPFSDGFSPEEQRNVNNGRSVRVGPDSVDAEETPLGKYKKSVRDAISEKWHRYKQENADLVSWGILKVQFNVDREGKVNQLQITKNEANATLAEFSLKAIRDARVPPMPDDVARSVGAQGLIIHYDIIIY